MELQELEISNITKDKRTQPRAVIDDYVVGEYRADMMAGDDFPPVMVFRENGNYFLADGWHRILAAEQAGKQTINAAIKDGSLRDAILYSCGVNADHGKRRTNGDKQRAVKKMLNDPEWVKKSDREIARLCRVTHPFVSRLRSSLVIVTSEEREYTTKHGTTAIMDTSNIGKSSGDQIPDPPPLIPEEQPQEQKPKYDPLNYRLFVSAVDELTAHIEPNSIDAIITDPPYPKEYIYTFGDLAKTSSTLLKDGGILVALCGHIYLPQYLELIQEHLSYHWLGMYYMPTPPHYYERNRLVLSRSKPFIVATKGKWTKKRFIDTVINERQDKDYHEWGQGISGFSALIEQFTNPNDTVLDPFVGGGTTAIATLEAGRYFIGSDISEEEVEKTRGRLT